MREFRPLGRTKLVREEVELKNEDMDWVRFASPFIPYYPLPAIQVNLISISV